MKRYLAKLLAVLMAACLLFSNAGVLTAFAADLAADLAEVEAEVDLPAEEDDSDAFASIKDYDPNAIGAAKVDETSLLILVDADRSADVMKIPPELADLGVVAAGVMVDISSPEDMAEAGYKTPVKWMLVAFDEDHKATEVALKFEDIEYVRDAEYNYESSTAAVPSLEEHPMMRDQYYINDDIQKAWAYLDEKGYMENLSNVVIAVIDTGVDYTHPDLINSMWVNANEIPDNGIDDDKNGYVDDVYGVSTVGNTWDSTGDPMDDNGHGTHVAGIIAADGQMAGVASGAKIMAIKAGQASGVFHDTDIIEAINYAVQQGADVINMSFGGYGRSAMVEDALAMAYSKAVLVAAAGNEGVDLNVAGPVYPASYNYVVGVMALDTTGGQTASYSNTDIVRRNSSEYEVAALGTAMYSTLPNGEYATWSGTSMATPYVSAIAALLRAKLDRETYSTRYIMSQIVGTAGPAVMNSPLGSRVCDISVSAYDALTQAPEPDLTYFDFFIFDDTSLSEVNNGDGIADAGETIGLGVYIRNHWGEAREVVVTLDSISAGGVANPYIEWVVDEVAYGDVGSFVTANNGILYDEEGIAYDVAIPFVFKLADNTPNSSALNFNVNMLCRTYDEEGNEKEFFFDENTANDIYQNSFTIYSRKGIELPRRIDYDMTLTADNYYIISGSTLVDGDATLTVEPGTQIQFWGDYSKELYAAQDVANLYVDGTLIIRGTEENPVEIFPADNLSDLGVYIQYRDGGRIDISYANIANPCIQATTIDHCYFYQNNFDYMCNMNRDMDGNWYHNMVTPYVYADTISNSRFFEMGYRYSSWDYRLNVSGKLNGNLFESCGLNFSVSSWSSTTFTNNVFLRNNRLVDSQYGDRAYLTSEFQLSGSSSVDIGIHSPVKNPITGSTYFALDTGSYALAERVAQSLGGHIVKADNYDELEFLKEYIDRYFGQKSEYYANTERYRFDYLGIGFNAISDYNFEYLGEFKEEGWLDADTSRNFPVMSPSYDDVSTWYYETNRFNEEGMLSYYGSNFAIIIELPGEPSLTELHIDAGDSLSLHTQSTPYQLTYSQQPVGVQVDAVWTSSDESVVTVDAAGCVTAVGVGQATVTVTDTTTEVTASITVTVSEYIKPESLTAEVGTVTLTTYKSVHALAPVITPADATISPIVWSSSDPAIATVSAVGVITALSSGEVTVTGTIPDEGLSVSYTVRVAIPVESVQLSFDYTTLYLDAENNKQIGVTCLPEYAVAVQPEFFSHDTSIVTVDEKGVLTAVGAGITVVEIRTSGNSAYCVVNVLANSADTKIQSVGGDLYNYSTFLTEDGTTWLLANMYSNDTNSHLIPQKLPVKTKYIQRYSYYYDGWLYIDMEDNLCYSIDFDFTNVTVIDTDVSFVEKFGNSYTNQIFYVKTDGTVWCVENVWEKLEESQIGEQVHYLSGIVDMSYHNYNIGYHLFIDSAGALWYMDRDANIKKPTSFVKVELDAKMVAFPANGTNGNWTILAENGELYRCYEPESNIYKVDLSYYYDYDKYASRIVKYVPYSDGSGIALLDDGTAVYYGYKDSLRSSGLIDCIEEMPSEYSIFVPISGITGIVDIGVDCFILEDGNVMTFHWGSGSKPLGNNTTVEAGRRTDAPVNAWFGVTTVTSEQLDVTDVQFTTADGTVHCRPDQMITGVNNNGEIILTLNRAATVYYLEHLTLVDEFGNRVNADIKISYLYITLTPKEPLKEGIEYTIDLPEAILADFFGNENEQCRISFVAAGTAVYPVPVTGISDANTAIQLGYNGQKQLVPTIEPADAYKKTIIWTSADESIARVDNYGVVTAVNNGTTTVTAKTLDGGFTVTYTVTVRIEIESVHLDASYILLNLTDKTTVSLLPVITPANAKIDALTYKSSDETVATIDQNGVITAKGIGKSVITVTVNGILRACLVNVTEDLQSTHIESVYSNSDYSVYYAADGTTWIVDDWFDSNAVTPVKLPVKTKYAAPVYNNSGYIYIDLDGNLGYIDHSFTNQQILDTDVKLVEDWLRHNTAFFYVKNDGAVYYRDGLFGTSTVVEYLADIVAMRYYENYSLFLDKDGSLWIMKQGAAIDEPASFKQYIIDTTFTAFVAYDGVMDAEGNVYHLSGFMNGNTPGYSEITSFNYYDLYKDQIVKYAFKSTDSGLALLKDGRVVYFGYVEQLCNNYGLDGYYTIPASGLYRHAFVELGFRGVADIGYDCVVLEDGTVLAFRTNGDKILGDGTKQEQVSNLTTPVAPLFGINIAQETLTLQKYEVTVGEGVNTLIPGELAEGVAKDGTIRLTFSTTITSVKTQYIMLADEFGNKVAIEVTLDGKILLVKPTEALKDGIQYTLTLPNSIMQNYFGVNNDRATISFVVAGTATYPVPVTGISDTNTSISLGNNGTAQLSPTVTPEDAYKKTVVWSTADANVATVDQNGLVTAINNGTTTVTARTLDGGFTVTYTVTVRIEIEEITFNSYYFMLNLVDKTEATLTPAVTPANAAVSSITFTSTDPSVATVDEAGHIKAVGEGTAVLQVKINDTVESCLVHVFADSTSLEIVSVYSDGNETVYYAADGTTWIVDDYFDNTNDITPIKLPVKTKYATSFYGDRGYLYIDTEDNLCFTDRTFTSTRVIDTNVKLIPTEYTHNWSLYYVKTDGTVWYKASLLVDTNSVQVDYLSGITAIKRYYHEYERYLFLDSDGALWSIGTDHEVDILANYVIHPVTGVKLVKFMNEYAVDDAGNLYYLSSILNGDTVMPQEYYSSFRYYDQYKDHIVKWAWRYSHQGLVLLDDGRVVYFGHTDYLFNDQYGLRGYHQATEDDRYTQAFIELTFPKKAVDIGYDCVVFEDGSVLAFRATDNKILGDGTRYNHVTELKAPVVPLFGVELSKEILELVDYEVSIGGTANRFTADQLAEGVAKDSAIKLYFNAAIISARTEFIALTDEFGNKVTATVTYNGKELVITPAEALSDGIQYTVTVQNSIMQNYFGNGNLKATFSFVAAGTATYPVPVTGISDTNTSISLGKGGVAQLSPTVTPDDAYKKTVVWSTADANVATVDQTGLVTAINNGTTTVTARTLDGGFTVTYTVTVRFEVETVTLNTTYLMLDLAEKTSAPLIPTITPADAVVDAITYRSSDDAIATVTAEGLVEAKGEGTAIIMVKVNDTVSSCLVRVSSDLTSVTIESVYSDSSFTVYYATDGTAWVVEDCWDTAKDISPIEIPVKVKYVAPNSSYSGYLLIDNEDRLCFLNRGSTTVSVLDTDVKLVEDGWHNGESFFYVKNDGTVWNRSYIYGTSKAVSLAGITDITYNNYNNTHHAFIDSHGTLWYIRNDKSVTDVQNYVSLLLPDTVFTAFSGNNHVLDANGNVYELSTLLYNSQNVALFNYSGYRDYELYKDHIVKWAHRSSEQGIALLDDGRVVYFGSTDALRNSGNYNFYGLTGCFDSGILDQMYGNVFIELTFENVKDIGRDCVVFEDGTVLAFRTSTDKILGDGTKYDQVSSLTSPVTPLFGIDVANEMLKLETYQVTVGGTAAEHPVNERVEGIDKNSPINLIFNSPIISIRSQYIMMADEFGNKVAISVTTDGNILRITPTEALRDGVLYIVTLPNAIMQNYFGNSNYNATVSFSVAGEAEYENKVDGITCGVSNLTMSKDEQVKLEVTVTPDNATQKRVVWTSSDPSVASVDADGTVTAKADGMATITATTVDGGFSVSISVTVFTTLLKDSVNIAVGSDMNTQLIYKQGSVAQNITWTSADPSIATVDASGKLTAVSEGITAVYVYVDGVAAKSFIVSVAPSVEQIKVNSVTSNRECYFTYITDAGVWVLNSQYQTPKFVAMENVTEAVSYDQYLLVRLSDNTVKTVYIPDGTVYEQTVLENVIQLAYRDHMCWALTADGTLYYRHLTASSAWTTYEYLENIRQISINKNHNNNGDIIFMLDDFGSVWYTSYHGGSYCELYWDDDEEEVKMVDITVCDGMYMKDANGKLHHLYGSDKEANERYSDQLIEVGFYDLGLNVVDYAEYYYGEDMSFLMLLSDGSLAYFGGWNNHYSNLEKTFEGIATIKQSAANSNLYYIKGLPTVQEIGAGYILLENGNVVMCVKYAYLGDGTYNGSDQPKLGTPHFYTAAIPTTVEAVEIILNGTATPIVDANMSVDTDVTGEIRINFSNPLILSTQIRRISLKDSAGAAIVCTIRVEEKSIVIIPDEALKEGETYVLVITPGSVQDIFGHGNERREILIKVAGSTTSKVTIYDQSLYPTTDYSPDYNKSELSNKINVTLREIISEYASKNSGSTYNAILNTLAFPDTTNWMNIMAVSGYEYFIPFANNYWGTTNTEIIDKMIYDVNDDFTVSEVIYTPYLTVDQTETMYPFVTSIKVYNAEGERVSQVGIEPIRVVVTFNRDMDTSVTPYVGFGGDYPYGDFQLEGAWTDARTWEGSFNVTAVTGSGTQYFKVRGAVAAGDAWLTTGNDYERFTFTISTYGAKSMTLNAVGGDGRVDLDWAQDDFDTLMGYNIYRSEYRDADPSSFYKLNSTVISNSKSTYVDTSVEQGKTYFYYFTVVQTDFSESDPSSVVEATVYDVSAPTIDHNPINETAIGNSVAIIAKVYDNIAVRDVVLYYKDQNGRFVETDMIRSEDQYGSVSYVASIPGTAVGENGVRYYIEAGDGRNTASRGTETSPLYIKTYAAHRITVSTVGNGSVSLSKTMAKAGETIYLTVTPNEGYALVPGSLTYTDSTGTHVLTGNSLRMPAGNITISATFTKASSFDAGDVTRDGVIDSADAVLILRYDAGLTELDSEQKLLADINGDGYVDVADAARILQIDAGR